MSLSTEQLSYILFGLVVNEFSPSVKHLTQRLIYSWSNPVYEFLEFHLSIFG